MNNPHERGILSREITQKVLNAGERLNGFSLTDPYSRNGYDSTGEIAAISFIRREVENIVFRSPVPTESEVFDGLQARVESDPETLITRRLKGIQVTRELLDIAREIPSESPKS